MARKYTLYADGYEVLVTVRGNKYLVDLNGQPYYTYKVGTASYWLGHNEDFPINLGDRQMILAVRKRKIRLVENGYYLDNGEPFAPVAPLPKWVWIFVALNVLIPIISVGGAINILIALLGVSICAAAARNQKFSFGAKIGVSIAGTVAAWAIWIVFALLVGAIGIAAGLY